MAQKIQHRIFVVLSGIFCAIVSSLQRTHAQNVYLLATIGPLVEEADLTQLNTTDGLWNFDVAFSVSHNQHIAALSFDCVSHNVYYSVSNVGVLARQLQGGGSPVLIVADRTDVVRGVAVDWLNRTLYWTNFSNQKIMTTSLASPYTTGVLYNLTTSPYGIVAIPRDDRRVVMWSSYDVVAAASTIQLVDLATRFPQITPMYYTSNLVNYISSNYILTDWNFGNMVYWTETTPNGTNQIISAIVHAYLNGYTFSLQPQTEYVAAPNTILVGLTDWNGNIFWAEISPASSSSWILSLKVKTTNGAIDTILRQSLGSLTASQVSSYQSPLAIAPFNCPS